MSLDAHTGPHPGDSPIGCDQKRLSFGRHSQNLSGTIRVDDALTGVRDHRERELEFVDEPALGVRLVSTDSDNRGSEQIELRLPILEVLGLVRSTGRVCTRVEIHRHPAPLEGGETELLAGRGLSFDRWCDVALVEFSGCAHGRTSSRCVGAFLVCTSHRLNIPAESDAITNCAR